MPIEGSFKGSFKGLLNGYYKGSIGFMAPCTHIVYTWA